jgi:iduronate 2-sulfatase
VIDQSKQIELLHAYAACVSYVDAQIGRLLHHLRESERLSRTVIILWSDHGWHLGEQSAWGKMTNFEIATRVPLIIAAPGIPPARTKTIAELVDLYPTICDLAGADLPKHLEGESLLPSLVNPGAKHDSIALCQYARFRDKYMGRAIRTDRHRFIAWMETETGRIVDRELYDHQSDPAETQNRAGDPANAKLVRTLQSQLQESFHLTP